MNRYSSLITSILILLICLANEPSRSYSFLIDGPDSNQNSSIQETLALIFDAGSGIFAGFIIVVSLIAYWKLRSKRLLLITSAFVFFLIRSVLSRLDFFVPETLELLLAVVSFVGLILFSLAVLQMGRLWMSRRSTV
jgi:hypothetical protein